MKGSVRGRTRWMLAAMGVGALILAAPFSAAAQEAYIGEIRMVAFDFAPRGWALCQGQLLPISENPTLFSILGDRYGGDGRTTFALPDLRGRAAIHVGYCRDRDVKLGLGEKGGRETVALTQDQIPAHTHGATVRAVSSAGDSASPGGTLWAATEGGELDYSTQAPSVEMAPHAVEMETAEPSQPHENMPPFVAINYIIAVRGIYPPRWGPQPAGSFEPKDDP